MTEAVRTEEIRYEEELREELVGKRSTETYGISYLIEAGADAGKTYILVNRMINQLLTGTAKPEELAAITFTEKATQEMVDRIDRELLARLEEAEGDCGRESPEAERIRSLIEGIDQMQISTIHSFCRTLLTTMPFSSALGPEFEVSDDPAPLADAFFEQQIRECPERFQTVRDITGIGYELLKESFYRLCESRAEIVYDRLDEAGLNRRMDDMRTQAGNLYALVREHGSEENIRSRTSKTVQNLMPKINEVLRLRAGPKEAFVQMVLEACNPCGNNRSMEAGALARILPGTIKDNEERVRMIWNQISETWGGIIHSLSMELFSSMIPDYQDYKRQQKVATQQDLLCCARDMLRTDAEARQYFHQKYACVYVDEMQDTDPVQAQILFYLTTGESDFDADDWRNCRPVPGSLFLVGDPKQAIYRFRGADITVYKTLETLFQNGIGRVEHLHFNFRSSSEITDFSDRMFRELLTGGDYQAACSGMSAVAGASEHARIIAYSAEKENDPAQVAAFIAEMVRLGTTVGTKDKQHKATYEDFLILTNTNRRTEDYVRALSGYGIPCNMAGAKKYAEIPQLVRGNAVLQYLADPDDEMKLATVLAGCYQIPFSVLRAYRQRTGSLTADSKSVKAALAAAGHTDAYADLLAGLEELYRFREQARSLPGIAVLENIWQKSCAVWQNREPSVFSKEYPMVLQFLHELRDSGGGLTELAAKAEELLQGAADRELLLEEEKNCVRVMNLHKAKGLEAEIVILAYDSPFKTDAQKHTVFDGNRESLYMCMARANPYGGSTVYAKPPGWDDGPGNREQEFLKAQVVRLLYVAATRAKTGLIICTAKKNTWAEFAEKCVSEQEQEPDWQQAVAALESGETSSPQPDLRDSEPVEVDTEEMEESLVRDAGLLSGARHLDISPSMLERRDELLRMEGDVPETEHTVQFADAHLPHGAKWGTVVHRLMELCVRSRAYDQENRMRLALQAVFEPLSDEELSGAEKRMLDPQHQYPEQELLFEALAAQAGRQTAFLGDREHALRKLLDSGKCYAELTFETPLSAGDPIWKLCSSVMDGQSELPVELRGVIDLAVREDRGWVLVDYKTDARWKGETEAQYAERLKRQYTPQLRIYREILKRLNQGEVSAAYLCAVSLGGMLVEV